ncbi:hypothetical protein HBB16_13070 [Pseudonocardia sp. MCCB 268]|nr:hypothetical protein [Pseudonocardia cytotoxica]
MGCWRERPGAGVRAMTSDQRPAPGHGGGRARLPARRAGVPRRRCPRTPLRKPGTT